MKLDSVVVYKWHTPGYRSKFESWHVNVHRRSFAEHYRKPHRYICITDDPTGLDADIEVVPLWDTFSKLRNPTWPTGPNCFRRLPGFAKEFEKVAGHRILFSDIDVVFTGQLDELVERDEDFVIWQTENRGIPYCASLYLMTAGSQSQVFERFDPERSPLMTRNAGYRGSDQAWINFCLGKSIPSWNTSHGVYSYGDHVRRRAAGRLPNGARVVIFHGKPDPWDAVAMAQSPWLVPIFQKKMVAA